jgi:hypothetical protein
MLTPQTQQLMQLHKHYMHGHLAVDGGVCSQPGFYLEAMEIISEWTDNADRSNR